MLQIDTCSPGVKETVLNGEVFMSDSLKKWLNESSRPTKALAYSVTGMKILSHWSQMIWPKSREICNCRVLILPYGEWKEYERSTFSFIFFFFKETSAIREWRSNMRVTCLLIHFMAFLATSLRLFLFRIVLAFWQEAYFTSCNRQSVHCHYKFMKPGYFWVYAAN